MNKSRPIWIFNKCAQKLDGKIFDLLIFLMTKTDKLKTKYIEDSVNDTFEKVVPRVSINLALLINYLQILQSLNNAWPLVSAAFE